MQQILVERDRRRWEHGDECRSAISYIQDISFARRYYRNQSARQRTKVAQLFSSLHLLPTLYSLIHRTNEECSDLHERHYCLLVHGIRHVVRFEVGHISSIVTEDVERRILDDDRVDSLALFARLMSRLSKGSVNDQQSRAHQVVTIEFTSLADNDIEHGVIAMIICWSKSEACYRAPVEVSSHALGP